MAAGVALPLKAQKLPDWPGTVLTSKVEGHLSGGGGPEAVEAG